MRIVQIRPILPVLAPSAPLLEFQTQATRFAADITVVQAVVDRLQAQMA